MNAAIYARKSTEQDDTDAEMKSAARQIEDARAFARLKGWRVVDAHVYKDEAISGAETRRLVNRQRMLAAVGESGPPPFQVLIMRDASRLSRRDGDEAFGELKGLAQRGLEIWFYGDGTQFTFGTFGDNVLGFVRAEMNAEYRRQIAKWTHEAHARKVKAGHVPGGRVFGYDNVPVDGHKHKVYRINDEQAEVIRRIFALCVAGTGYTRIAKQLNSERAPAPRPQQNRPSGWSPSTVNDVLHRSRYRGEVVWNKTRKRGTDGKTAPTGRPEGEWLRDHRPDLQIVSDEVWDAAQARLTRKRADHTAASDGRVGGRRRDIDSQYWLSGFARCESCGGALATMSRRTTGRQRILVYGCLAHHKRGATVCKNALVKPVECVDAALLSKFVGNVLRPAAVRALLDIVFEAIQPTTVATSVEVLRKDLKALDAKIARLTASIEEGEAIAPIVARLRQRQTERDVLLGEIGAAESMQSVTVDRRGIERRVLAEVAHWQSLLAGDIAERRQFLRDAMEGPIYFKPEGNAYRFTGTDRRGRLITDLVCGSNLCGVPTRIRIASRFIFRPAPTLDVERRRILLLRRIGGTRQAGSAPVSADVPSCGAACGGGPLWTIVTRMSRSRL